jgi:polyhydroxyalkanoate synthesis regulator phasin
MKDFISKAFYMGLGAASLTKAKIEELAKEYADRFNESEAEGKALFEKLNEEAKKAREEMESSWKENSDKMYEKLNITTKQKMEMLEARVRILEEKIEQKADRPMDQF